MELFYRELGEGPPLIILHGLYGSSDNWLSIARILAEHFHVYLPDQRNHGQSPHSPRHDYHVLCEDLADFMENHAIGKAVILGHSMGGKTAMFYAACHPESISTLIVVDISPRTYPFKEQSGTSFSLHKQMMEAMLRINPETLTSRRDAMEKLENEIPSDRIRQFLLKNLTHGRDNRFRWKMNLPVLYEQLPNILKGLDSEPEWQDKQFFSFPVLFIRGSNSGYIGEKDIPVIKHLFPYAEIVSIPDTGHWVHAEQPELFIKTLLEFLKG